MGDSGLDRPGEADSPDEHEVSMAVAAPERWAKVDVWNRPDADKWERDPPPLTDEQRTRVLEPLGGRKVDEQGEPVSGDEVTGRELLQRVLDRFSGSTGGRDAATERDINREIDEIVDRLNPRYDPAKSAYSENCTGVVQAYDLRRRGSDVQPGPLEPHLRTDQGGSGGRPLSVIEQAYGRTFTDGSKTDIERAFQAPGSRGVIYIQWHPQFGGGGHVFNVENVNGKVRFVDGQPTPGVTDATHYFGMGRNTKYLRLDDLPQPPDHAVKPYLEP